MELHHTIGKNYKIQIIFSIKCQSLILIEVDLFRCDRALSHSRPNVYDPMLTLHIHLALR